MTLEGKRKLTTCDMCGNIMAAVTSSGVCNDCWDKDEEMFQQVKSVMKFGQKVLPEELSAKTGVELKHIQRWVRQGRFG